MRSLTNVTRLQSPGLLFYGNRSKVVYADNVETREQLARTMEAAETIRADPQTVSRATTSILRRARLYIQQFGGILNN